MAEIRSHRGPRRVPAGLKALLAVGVSALVVSVGTAVYAAADREPTCVEGTLVEDVPYTLCVTLPDVVTETVVSASPSPYPSPVPTTVTETVTASASPSVPASPAPTTPAPSTPPATTPTPTTPAPTTPAPTAPAGGCMPVPSACGWPDATNTGVPAGVTLRTYTGPSTITAAGTVLDGYDIRGCITVNAANVVIRNSRIGANGNCPNYVVTTFNRSANLLLEDSEIVLSGWNTKGIAFNGYTARRVHFYGGSDCAHMERSVLIEDSFCEIPTGGPSGGPHYDGFQSDGYGPITLRHNTIRVPYGQTSAILMSTNTKPIYNVTIVDNLVAGGGWTIYCGTDEGGPVLGTLVFSGNVVARTYFPKGGKWGPTTWCPSSGWRWDT